jgi:GR25 family glycosyltransferase involved in LPS biosynthesis
MSLPVYVINLDRDAERLETVRRQLAAWKFLRLVRVRGFAGRELPDVVCHVLTTNAWSHEHKGTLGCFISHLMSWQMIARQDEDVALVVEDNADFSQCGVLERLRLPPDAELVFCNARTAYPDGAPVQDAPRFRPVEPVAAFVETHGRAVGGDGYLLTRAGAEKLVRYAIADRLFSHVDLRLLAYCLAPSAAETAEHYAGSGKTVMEFRGIFNQAHRLRGYSMVPAMTDRRANIVSTRMLEDEAGKTA